MLDENQMIYPGRSGDGGDAALDAALAAADEDMLSAISNGLDLDIGLARILEDLGGSPATRPGIQAPAHPEEDRRIPDATISRNPFPPIHTRGTGLLRRSDVAVLIRNVNALDEAVEDQFLRTRQAAGIAARSARAAEQAAAEAAQRRPLTGRSRPNTRSRRAPLPRRVTLALGTVVLDGLACYLAAQALGGSLDATLAWTGLFLAVLAGGEIALGFYRDRSERAWRVLVRLSDSLSSCSAPCACGSWPLSALAWCQRSPEQVCSQGRPPDSLPSAISRCGPQRRRRPGVPAVGRARRGRQRGSPGPRPTGTRPNVTASSTLISGMSGGWR